MRLSPAASDLQLTQPAKLTARFELALPPMKLAKRSSTGRNSGQSANEAVVNPVEVVIDTTWKIP